MKELIETAPPGPASVPVKFQVLLLQPELIWQGGNHSLLQTAHPTSILTRHLRTASRNQARRGKPHPATTKCVCFLSAFPPWGTLRVSLLQRALVQQKAPAALGWGFPGGTAASLGGRGFRLQFGAAFSPCRVLWLCPSRVQGLWDPPQPSRHRLSHPQAVGCRTLTGLQLLQKLLSVSVECCNLHVAAWAPAASLGPHFAVSYVFTDPVRTVRLGGVLRHPLLKTLPLPHQGRVTGNHSQPLLLGGCSSAPFLLHRPCSM